MKPILLLLISIVVVVEGQKIGPACDLTTNAIPYVRLLNKRTGAPIQSLSKTGFLDLSNSIHKTLCVNGPAILYNSNEMRKTETIFSLGSLKIYTHFCMVINQIKSDKAIQIRTKGINKGSPPSVKDFKEEDFSDITSKVTGIYLISDGLDYYNPTAELIPQHDLNNVLPPPKNLTAASFITIGHGPFCLKVEKLYDILLTRADNTTLKLCSWTFLNCTVSSTNTDHYNRIFDGHLTLKDFMWYNCPGVTLPTPTPTLIPTTSPPTLLGGFEPPGSTTTTTSSTHSPFAMIAPADPFSGDGTGGSFTSSIPDVSSMNFNITLDTCIDFPPRPSSVPPDCVLPDNKTVDQLLLSVLELPPIPGDDWPLLDSDLAWKKDILDQASEIFSQLSPSFPKTMPFTVARVLEYYLARAHAKDASTPSPKYRRGKDTTWDFLLSELNHCSNKIGANKALEWSYELRDEFFNSGLTPLGGAGDGPVCSTTSGSSGGSTSGSSPSSTTPSPSGTTSSTSTSTISAASKNNFTNYPIQEYPLPPTPGTSSSDAYPINIISIRRDKPLNNNNNSFLTPFTEDNGFKSTLYGECIFFYEDLAETQYELNIAIDTYWKIWSTVIGYCNKHYKARKSESFPRLYNSFHEDFLLPVERDWKYPAENEALKIILGAVNTEIAQRWLDIGLESAYLVSDSKTFRPPRPLTLGGISPAGGLESNYFLSVPEFNNIPVGRNIKCPD